MKKILLIAGLLILPFVLQAQSFQVSNATSNLSGDGSTTLEAHADLKNNSSTEKIVRVERIINNLAPSHQSYFCWNECFAPPTTLSGNDTIAAGATSTKFISYLVPANASGTSSITYKFFDLNNPNDSVVQQFTYTVSVPTSVEKTLTKSVNDISLAYPNPANSYTRIDYELAAGTREANIRIYNILGSEVRKIELPARQGTVSIDTDGMSEGMYLYSLVANGKTISTRKFIVKR